MAGTLELRLQEAASHGLPHRQFLELLFQDELNVRAQRSLERRKKLAQFPDLQPLENFDWQFNPQINRAQIYQLATAQFVRERRDVLLLGPPGLGKSHIAQARQLLRGRHVGRKLDFLVQELFREANTTGSKLSNAATTQEIVQMKSHIEQLREQVQNLE